jgi:hypothetical protein
MGCIKTSLIYVDDVVVNEKRELVGECRVPLKVIGEDAYI